MPVPVKTPEPVTVYPALKKANIDAARTSAWYDTFEDLTIPSTFVDIEALGEREAFLDWLNADSIFMPEDADGGAAGPSAGSVSTASIHSAHSDEDEGSDAESEPTPVYRLPKLNAAIRDALRKYGGAVFPKLNWTSPRDAAFLLPQTTGPLYCMFPADVYLAIKSSDFIHHDLDRERVYAGCVDAVSDEEERAEGEHPDDKPMKLELVLKKYVEMNPAREVRCFVRNRILLGICQGDTNFYEHLQPADVQAALRETVKEFWLDEIRDNYEGGDDYVFDLYLPDPKTAVVGASPTHPIIIDFGPYRASTDPLLFTYEELATILERAETAEASTSGDGSGASPAANNGASSSTEQERLETLPVVRVIDSQSHPDAARNAPQFQANMMPIEMLEMSQGRDLGELQAAWAEAVAQGMQE